MTSKNRVTEEEKRAVINYLSGKITTDDTRIFTDWLSKSDENKRLADQLSFIWNATNFHERVNNETAWEDIQKQVNQSAKKKNGSGYAVFMKYAAILIAAVFLGAFGYHLVNNKNAGKHDDQFIEYISPLGSRSFVQLSDGSKIWLNAGTTLKYRKNYGTSNREIYLSGEAFFNVEKDKNLPFIVKTDEINIIALGTSFNVKAYAEEETIETTLIEGSVKLVATAGKLADDIFLKANEKAVYTRVNNTVKWVEPDKKAPETEKSAKLQIIESIEPEPVISWKNQRWVIQNEKLGDLAVKLERRFNVNLIFNDEQLKEYSFGGTLENETLEQILEAISFSSPIKYTIDKNTVYIDKDDSKGKFKNENRLDL